MIDFDGRGYEPHNAHNLRLIEEFRAKEAALLEHTPLLVLTATGERLGQPQITPPGYFREGKRLIVIAAKRGAPRHPVWYHDLVKHLRVQVEIGTEVLAADAVLIEGPERERLWSEAVAWHSILAEHQAKTARLFPIIAPCRRAGERRPARGAAR